MRRVAAQAVQGVERALVAVAQVEMGFIHVLGCGDFEVVGSLDHEGLGGVYFPCVDAVCDREGEVLGVPLAFDDEGAGVVG